jgi:DNA-binding MarR family transcriptional regulator
MKVCCERCAVKVMSTYPGDMSAAERATLKDDVDATLTASRALVGVVARSLADVLDQITLPQFRVLVVLCAEGPLRSGVLAERLGIHQSTFTRTADRLVAQGWIRREVSAESRREVLVDLTDSGRDLVIGVMKARRREIEKILRKASPDQREAIRAGFAAFARVAGEPEASLLLTLGV